MKSEGELCHQADAACAPVFAVDVFAYARSEFEARLDARCEIPEYVGGHVLTVFVLRACGTVAREIAAFGECNRSEKVGPEVILHAEVPADSVWCI